MKATTFPRLVAKLPRYVSDVEILFANRRFPVDKWTVTVYQHTCRACGAKRELGAFPAEKPTAGVGDRDALVG